MDPMERRKKIYEMAEDDAQYRRIKADFDRARDLFDRITLSLPEEERNLLQSYPGMGHFLHHRMLTLICENMCFEDEVLWSGSAQAFPRGEGAPGGGG